MPGFVLLMRCVGRAAAKNAVRALARLVPFGEAVFDVALDTYDEYCKQQGEDALKDDLAELAQASPTEVRQAAEAIAAQVADGQPPEVRQALVAYLVQMPVSIRQMLRRPADPTGTTLPPNLRLNQPENLAPFLPSALPRFQPGDRPLAADWELVELLGKGGFGEVWKAKHIHQARKKPVALKFCLNKEAAATLSNEASLHDHLDRVREEVTAPGIVPLLETFLRADPPCLMYELIEGGDLTGLMQDLTGQDKLTARLATQIVHRLASIVAIAHRLDPPLVHRDLKLSNFLVRPSQGELPELFVADFGIGSLVAGHALAEQRERATVPGRTLPTAIRGAYTPLYASPQQVRGEKADPRDDVHALGIIWYQLVVGDRGLMAVPSDWRDLVEERGLTAEQINLLASCIASRAEKRPANASVLAESLKATLGGGSPSPPPTPPPPPPVPLPPDKKPPEEAEDDEEEKDSYAILVSLIVCPAGGGVVGAGVGWFSGEILGAFLGGFIGAFVGFGLSLVVAYVYHRVRTRVERLLAEAAREQAALKETEARDLLLRALGHDPHSVATHLALAMLLLRANNVALRDPPQAVDYVCRAVDGPGKLNTKALKLLVDIHRALADHSVAQRKLEKHLEQSDLGAVVLNQIAWVYATSADAGVRNGVKAVELATMACTRSQWTRPALLDTLAAAHAEAGQFEAAVRWQFRAVELAAEARKPTYQSRVRLYEMRQAYRDYT